MQDTEKHLGVASFLCGIVTSAIAVLYGSWALSTVWSWFVAPVFGLISPTYAQWIGLRVFASAIIGTLWVPDLPDDNSSRKKLDRAVWALAWSIVAPTFVIAMAFIVRQLI